MLVYYSPGGHRVEKFKLNYPLRYEGMKQHQNYLHLFNLNGVEVFDIDKKEFVYKIDGAKPYNNLIRASP